MSFLVEGQVGPRPVQDGSEVEVRLDRQGGPVTADGVGRYHEAASRGQVFSLALPATTTGVSAGNIAAAAAAAVTQFALINPATSKVVLSLLKFGLGVVSGTPGAGPVFHGYIPGAGSISAASPGGVIRNHYLGGGIGSAAVPWALAAGSALTGGQAPVTLRAADFASTGTAQASVGELKAIEAIDGEIVIPPGVAWLPLWGAAGTSLLNGYSITWQELPV